MLKKTVIVMMIMITLLVTISNGAQITFIDVEDHWAQKEIYAMAEKWIILGRGDGTFGPDDNITKSHAFLMFSRLMGYYDVENTEMIKQGVEEYKEVLKDAGITQAINEICFLIKSEIIDEDYIIDVLGNGQESKKLTRIEASVIFVKLLKDEENLSKNPVLIYNDTQLISYEYRAYVEYVNDLKLMIGFEDNTFNPNGFVTRAQIATILYRINNVIYDRATSKQIGIIDNIDLENWKITMSNEESTDTYKIIKNFELYNNDIKINSSKLKVNDKVTAYFENNEIVKLIIDNNEQEIYAKLESVLDDGYISINAKNVITKYKLASNVEIFNEDRIVKINNVNVGTDIKVTILNNRVIKIEVGKINYIVSGIIEEIIIGKDKSHISIKNLNDEVKKYEVAPDMTCDYDGVEAGIYDLRLDMEVKLNITQEGIKKVIIETITNIEIIEGEVQNILPNIFVFTVKTKDDNVMMIFLDENETIIKTLSGSVKNVDNIEKYDNVCIYGRYEGDVFYPIQVIIQK